MNGFLEKITELLDKLNIHSFEDVFPLNAISYTTENVVKSVGIYIAALVVCALLIIVLGGIPVLGVIIKIITTIAALYAVVGMVALLLQFMKYN